MSHPLRDIEVGRLPASVLINPRLGAFLQTQAELVATLYRAKVAKRTGQLAASANPYVTVGGHKNDRLIGKVVVGGGVEYAALHEFGSKSNPNRRAAKDLAEVMQTLTKGP